MAHVAVGNPIPLVLVVENDLLGEKFPRAILRDATGAFLPSSPLEMIHIGGGVYANTTVLMPDTDFVSAVYELFDDAGYTTLSPDHVPNSASERFEKDLSATELNQIINTAVGTGRELHGRLASASLNAKLSTDSLVGAIDRSDLVGKLEAEGELIGKLKLDSLEGELN